jgi:hypothetical protein
LFPKNAEVWTLAFNKSDKFAVETAKLNKALLDIRIHLITGLW